MRDLEDGWIHWSHVNQWVWCPRKFKYAYIEGEPSPKNVVMEIGTIFHDFAHLFHNRFTIYQFEEFNRLQNLLLWVMEEVNFQEAEMPNVLKMYIERFITFECRRYWYYCRILPNSDEEFFPYQTELNIRSRIGDQIGRTGTVDAVFVSRVGPTTTVRLREYKVSRRLNLSTVRGQLTFYKSIIDRAKLFGKNVQYRYELYNPLLDNNIFPLETGSFERSRYNRGVHNDYWFLERPLKATETALEKKWLRFIEAVESGYFPKQKRSAIPYKCMGCAYYGLCWGRY